MKISVLSLLLVSFLALGDSNGLGPFGLSGWQGLPCSDIIPEGTLRAGASLEYVDTDGGTVLAVPVKGCWGAVENVELAAELPFVPVDNAWEGSFVGDFSLSGGWLYESTRGGTALKLTGRLTLPTGEENRDRGAEIAVGGVTSTTFLDFRLSMAGEYALNGRKDPLNERIRDIFYFTGGGSSYISPDLLLSAALSGSTAGTMEATAAVQFIMNDDLSADCGVFTDLQGYRNFGVRVGCWWTGRGF